MLQVDGCVATVHYGQIEEPGSVDGTVLSGDRSWRERAVCGTEDPELFFPVGDCGPALVQVAEAKAVCVRCPVVAECLSFALVALPEGVAGGLTAQERSELRSKRCSTAPVADAAGLSERLPGEVDGHIVAALMAGQRVPGASRQELAHAAVGLHRAGRGCGWIATRLAVGDRQVYRWLTRHRAGRPLNPPRGVRRTGVPA